MSTMKGLKTHWGRGWGSGQGNRCRPLRLLMRTYGQSVVHPRRTQRVYSIIAGHKWRLGSAGIVFIVRTCETWKKSIMNAKEKAVWMNFFFSRVLSAPCHLCRTSQIQTVNARSPLFSSYRLHYLFIFLPEHFLSHAATVDSCRKAVRTTVSPAVWTLAVVHWHTLAASTSCLKEVRPPARVRLGQPACVTRHLLFSFVHPDHTNPHK